METRPLRVLLADDDQDDFIITRDLLLNIGPGRYELDWAPDFASALALLAQNQIAHVAPDPLPSALYADASHPLTKGYHELARRLLQNVAFQKWLTRQ